MLTGKTVHQRGWHGCSLMSARLQRLRGKQKGLTLQSPAIVLRGQAHLLRAEPSPVSDREGEGQSAESGAQEGENPGIESAVCAT